MSLTKTWPVVTCFDRKLWSVPQIGDEDVELTEISVIPNQPHVNGDVRDEDASIDKFFQQVSNPCS